MSIEEANVAQVQANTELAKAHARLMNAQAAELERANKEAASAE